MCTLADVVGRRVKRLEAYSMFAVMLLTGRALEVHVTDRGCNLAESAAVLGRALASIRVDAVHALSSILK